jgi:electron transfer flavoprotein alpha subunit
MSKEILIWAQARDGKLHKTVAELAGEGMILAQSLGVKLSAVLIGKDVAGIVSELGELGVQKVYLAEDPSLDKYTTEPYTGVFATIIEKVQPLAVLVGATFPGRDLSARLAGRVKGALIADVVGLGVEGGKIKAVRPMYAGKVLAEVVPVADSIPVISLRPNAFPAAAKNEGAAPEVEKIDSPIVTDILKTICSEIILSAGDIIDVTEADIIVSGGRGMKEGANFKLLFDFAKTIGAAVGGSRAAVDAGWIGHEHQVGQTGKTVSPSLYIACGISGAIQHIAGMSSSKVIVAINKDPDANIFKLANYGIVGDLFQVLPVLGEEIRKIRTS